MTWKIELPVGRAVAWHRKRFPNATHDRAAMKIGEEFGELMGAAIAFSGTEHPERRDQVGPEAADVAITLMVFLARFHPEVDLETEVKLKLTKHERDQQAREDTAARMHADMYDPI